MAGRSTDGDSRIVITADEGRRGVRTVPLKRNVDAAAALAPVLKRVIVVRATGGDVAMDPARDDYYDELAAEVSADCPAEAVNDEDPRFLLYTYGSTGKPTGRRNPTGAYHTWEEKKNVVEGESGVRSEDRGGSENSQ